MEETIAAVPYESDLASFADDTVPRSLALWDTTDIHERPPTALQKRPGQSDFCSPWRFPSVWTRTTLRRVV